MDKATFIYMLIEAVVFLIPIGTLAVKLGKTLERIDNIEKRLNEYNGISDRLTSIETKLDFILGGKVKLNGKEE